MKLFFKRFTPSVSQCHPPRATRSRSKERRDLRTDPQKDSPAQKFLCDFDLCSITSSLQSVNRWVIQRVGGKGIEIIEIALAFILGQVAFDFAAFASGFSGGRADDVFVLILPQCQWFFGRTTY